MTEFNDCSIHYGYVAFIPEVEGNCVGSQWELTESGTGKPRYCRLTSTAFPIPVGNPHSPLLSLHSSFMFYSDSQNSVGKGGKETLPFVLCFLK